MSDSHTLSNGIGKGLQPGTLHLHPLFAKKADDTIQRLKYLVLLSLPSLQSHVQRPNLKPPNRPKPIPIFSPSVLLLYHQLPLGHRLLLFPILLLHPHRALLHLLLVEEDVASQLLQVLRKARLLQM